jgi:hypothetical protein
VRTDLALLVGDGFRRVFVDCSAHDCVVFFVASIQQIVGLERMEIYQSPRPVGFI